MTSTKKLTLLLLPLVPLSALGIVEVANAITKPATSTTCELHASPTVVQPKIAQPEPRYTAPPFAKQPAPAPVQAPQPTAVG